MQFADATAYLGSMLAIESDIIARCYSAKTILFGILPNATKSNLASCSEPYSLSLSLSLSLSKMQSIRKLYLPFGLIAQRCCRISSFKFHLFLFFQKEIAFLRFYVVSVTWCIYNAYARELVNHRCAKSNNTTALSRKIIILTQL